MWLDAYYEAYDLMTANGADSLTELEPPTTTEEPTTTTAACEDNWTSTVCASKESNGRCVYTNVINNCQATCGYC